MAISLDGSTTGIVVFCTTCIGWTRSADTRGEGHMIAENHEFFVHPGDVTAAKSAEKYRSRHAARTGAIR
jgi:hypothetical protein